MNDIIRIGHASLAAILVVATLGLASKTNGQDYTPFEGEKTAWRGGFDRHDFVMDEETLAIEPFKRDDDERFGVKAPPKGQRRCIVVVPKSPAPGNPWSWQACYWDHEPQAEVELLRRGFHVAFVTTDPGKTWDAWYAYLTEKHGLSKKPAFIGMSRGGINEYDWTSVNPDKVACIYADNPAIRPAAFDKLDDLARRDVPLLNICGSLDFLLERHTLPIESRYHQLGGRITVMIKEGAAHHPHSLRNPKIIADWIEQNSKPSGGDRPSFADETYAKSSYYSFADSYNKLEEEKTYATCRGPGFTECYDRYDATTKSQWGITGMAVVVPKTVAPGKPWVFRADRIGREPRRSTWPSSPEGFTSSRPPSSRNPARSVSSGTRSTRSSPTTDSPASPRWKGPARRPGRPTPGPSRTPTRFLASTPRTPGCTA